MSNIDSGFKRNKKIHKYIYKSGNYYQIIKSINGHNTYFKTLPTLHEAIVYRDKLIANDWKPLGLSEEEIYGKNYNEYYKSIQRTSNGRRYHVYNNKNEYIAAVGSVEEALYYRDLFYNCDKSDAPRPSTMDLTSDNKYILEGLEYPLPERLILFKNNTYGEGRIVKKGEFSYAIEYGKKETCYICSCRTYEQAYYVHQELNKCGWDKSQLQRILDEYPVWYTRLMELYRYVNIDYHYQKNHNGEIKYVIQIPRQFLEEGKQIGTYTGYSHLEDALYERDFLVAHDWDYDELVESIDDSKNPYYDMELPPYPQRKILNLKERDYHEKELTMIYELLKEEPDLTQQEVCELLGIGEVTLRNWLNKFWNTNYYEFKRICLSGENPVNVLEKVPLIYNPDLSRPKPANFKGYIQYSSRDKRSPYKVVKDSIRYGSYFNKKQARKAVKLLEACDWDKSKVSEIQEKVGWKPLPKRGNIYPNPGNYGWTIRHKDKNKKMINYGSYKDYDLAVMVRDMLILNDWNKEEYPSIRELAENALCIERLLTNNMFSGDYDYTLLEKLCYQEQIHDDKNKYIRSYGTKYTIQKYINGVIKTFGVYDTKEEAMSVRNLLLDNNWDEDVLELVKEVGLNVGC